MKSGTANSDTNGMLRIRALLKIANSVTSQVANSSMLEELRILGRPPLVNTVWPPYRSPGGLPLEIRGAAAMQNSPRSAVTFFDNPPDAPLAALKKISHLECMFKSLQGKMDAIACLSYLSHQHEITIGSGLKKHFEDGVVKRENLQPNEEVEIARHASRGNWRREKRKTSWGREQTFGLWVKWLCIELQPLELAMGQQPLKFNTVGTGRGLLSSLLCQIMNRFHRTSLGPHISRKVYTFRCNVRSKAVGIAATES
ncbi:hypothetical protein Tco_1235412 [Tanacetum coccineum]